MAGQLNQHPLAELVREISAANLSGALRLTHERAKVVVYFESGAIVYAASNLRAFRLSESLRRWKALTEGQLASLPNVTSDAEFAEALVQQGGVSQNLLEEFVERQVSELIFHALQWADGLWDFDSRVRLAENIRISLKIKELMVASARRVQEGRINTRFSNPDERILPAESAPEGINLQPTEAFVLTRVDAPLSVRELLTISGLPETETLRAVYTLALGGFLHLDSWPQALTPQEMEKALAAKAASVKSSDPRPAQQPNVEGKSAAETKEAEAPQEERDEEQELGDFFARLSMATNYYQVLGVVRTADAGELKRKYHALAKRFHPDRFRKNADEALQGRVGAAFAQIAQAYETLKNKQSRAVYDSKLLKEQEASRNKPSLRVSEQHAGGAKTSASATHGTANQGGSEKSKQDSSPYQAEERFKQGLAALHQGDRAFAIACFGDAARLVPTEPRYRAYFGRALAGDERMRRGAESEFKAAIALDANNASYHVMLAELYCDIGLIRRAHSEVERALAINPQDKAARSLFEKLKGRD
jgi:curved DNA-binding protein CbpA